MYSLGSLSLFKVIAGQWSTIHLDFLTYFEIEDFMIRKIILHRSYNDYPPFGN